MENHEEKNFKRHSIKEFLNFGPVFGYFFRKHDPARPSNFNLKMMHGINKISILMFLAALCFLLVKKIFFR